MVFILHVPVVSITRYNKLIPVRTEGLLCVVPTRVTYRALVFFLSRFACVGLQLSGCVAVLSGAMANFSGTIVGYRYGYIPV